MTKYITLEDLTKEEIISLLRIHFLRISTSEIRRVRFDTLSKKAKQMADEANAEMSQYRKQPGMESRFGFLRASEKFDEAMKLYDEADKVLKGE